MLQLLWHTVVNHSSWNVVILLICIYTSYMAEGRYSGFWFLGSMLSWCDCKVKYREWDPASRVLTKPAPLSICKIPRSCPCSCGFEGKVFTWWIDGISSTSPSIFAPTMNILSDAFSRSLSTLPIFAGSVSGNVIAAVGPLKRGSSGWSRSCFFFGVGAQGSASVSYTHLDVYKRQI